MTPIFIILFVIILQAIKSMLDLNGTSSFVIAACVSILSIMGMVRYLNDTIDVILLPYTAMAIAGETLVAAGTPAVVGQVDPLGSRQGRRGASLCLISTEDGKKMAEYKLDNAPVLNGMAIAGGNIFISNTAGKLECFTKAK